MSSISIMSDASCSVYDTYKRKQTRKYFDSAFVVPPSDAASAVLTHDNFQIAEDACPELRRVLETIEADLLRGVEMNFHVFFNKFDIAMDHLTVTERAALLRRAPKTRQSELTEKPTISAKSTELAKAKRRNLTTTIFDRLNSESNREWLQKKVEEKELSETTSCTFRPEIHMYTISESEETVSMK
jgi:hypothetical protein